MKKELEYYISAYAIFMHKRKLSSEKEKFINNNLAIYSNTGHNTLIETSSKNKNVKHIVVGDINKAKRVFITSYDVVNKTILPSFKFYPLDLDKSKTYEVLNLCLSLVILLTSCILSALCFQAVAAKGTLIKILTVIALLVLMFMIYKLVFSTCKINLSQDYFLSIIYALADNVEGDDNAYVLCDNSRINYFGIRDYLKEHQDSLNSKEIIVLSELITGDELFAISKGCEINKKDFTVLSDNKKHNILKYINKGCLITGAHRINDEIVVFGHRNDKDCSISIEKIKEIYEKLEKVSKKK